MKQEYFNKVQAYLLAPIIFSGLSFAEELNLSLNLSQKLTVSGVSSGGYMANQLHIAHSDKVSGAGIVAAGPYLCSEGNLMIAMKQCLTDGSALAEQSLIVSINKLAEESKIAALGNLKEDRVWLLHGTLDKRVGTAVSNGLFEQYSGLVSAPNIQYITDKPFNHGLPTQGFGVACSSSETPFINNCDFDAASEMMRWFYPDKTPAEEEKSGQTYTVEQAQSKTGKHTGLAQHAWLYVPEQCNNGAKCDLHISFHGCQQNHATIGTDYILHSGFNTAADQYNQVVLFPQVAGDNPLNPLACWDWWGYTGEDFAQRSGVQVSAVMALADGLQSNSLKLKEFSEPNHSHSGAAQ